MPEIKLKPIMVLTSFLLMLFMCVGLKAQTTEFSPEVSVSLSTYEAGEMADLTFSISQDAGEADMASSLVNTVGGTFILGDLVTNDVIGSGEATAGGGYHQGTFSILVDFAVSSNKTYAKAVNDEDGSVIGTFVLENIDTGTKILVLSPADGNNTTSGNSTNVTINGLFLNPDEPVSFVTTITSELEDIDVQEIEAEIAATDCNGDFGGSASIDDCGNCSGGNTDVEPCIDLSPSMAVSLTNTDCNESSSLTITVSQDANEPDMSTSLFTSNGGSFDFSTIFQGVNIGSASVDAAGGDLSFDADLIVSSVFGEEAVVTAVNTEDGATMGSFTIANELSGVSIFGNASYADGNNTTAGNTSTVVFNNIFVNPDEGVLEFYATVNAEVGPSANVYSSTNVWCPCSAPNVLDETDIMMDRFTLNWEAISNAANYDLRVRVQGAAEWINVSNIFTTTRTLYGLSASTVYEYQLSTTCDNDFQSDWGDLYTVSTLDPCATAFNMQSSDVLLNSASISWEADAGADSYFVRFKASNQAEWTVFETAETSMSFNELVSNTTYQWQVKVMCDASVEHHSAWTSTQTFTTLSPCANPIGLTVTNVTTNSATLSWVGNFAADHYTLSYSTDGQNWTEIVTSSTSVELSDLDNSTTYQWQLMTSCTSTNDNNSDVVAGVSFTTLTPCVIPQNTTTTNILIDRATVSWDAVASADHYNLQTRESGTDEWVEIYVPGNVTSKIIYFLSPDVTYEWRVQSSCDASNENVSPFTEVVSFTTLPTEGVSDLDVINIMLDRATVTWSAVDNAHHYDLRIKVLGAAEWNNITNIVTTSRTIYGLSASTEYEVEVRTSYDAGNENVSEWSSISFTTLSPCFTPNNIASSNVDLDGATLSWDGVAGAEGYEVRYKTGANPWINVEVTETSLDLSDLAFATAFNWQVRTICDASVEHMSAWSATQTFTTWAPCSEPNQLSITNISATSVTLSWSSSYQTDHVTLEYSPIYFYETPLNSDVSQLVLIGAETIQTEENTITITGLNPGMSYAWTLTASCQIDDSNNSSNVNGEVFTTLTPCDDVEGLTTSNILLDRATLNWEAVDGVDHYNLRFKESSSADWAQIVIAGNLTSKTIYNLSPGTDYEWQIQSACDANDDINNSAFSASQLFTTVTCDITTSTSVANIMTDRATIVWDAVDYAASYDVRIREQGDEEWVIINNISSTSRTIYGLTISTSYEYGVRTDCSPNSSTESGWTVTESFNTLGPCATPSTLETTGISMTTATVNWTAVEGDGYVLRYKSGGPWITVNTTETSAELIGLASGSFFVWQVRTLCDASVQHMSSWTPTATFSTWATCSDPTALIVTNVSTTSASLSWNAAWGTDHVTVEYSADGGLNWTSSVISGNSVTLNALASSTTYLWQVTASCQSDDSNNSSSVSGASFTTLTPCAVPADLSASDIQTDRLTVNWSAVSGANHYGLRFREQGAAEWTTMNYVSGLSRTIYNLDAGVTYEWEVRSSCDAVNDNVSAWSSTQEATTVGCDTPTNLSSTNVLTDRATFTWDAVGAANTYDLRISLSGANDWTTIGSISGTSRTVYGLSESTNYDYQVRSSCGSGAYSEWSTVASVTTLGPCLTPDNLTISNLALTTATVSWNAVDGAEGYVFKYRASGPWITINTTETSLEITGLDAGTGYNWTVRTMCSAEVNHGSSWAAQKYFTTWPVCQDLSALNVGTVGTSTAILSWNNYYLAELYTLQYSSDGGQNWTELVTSNSYVQLSGLSDNTTYVWQVMASCQADDSNNSSFVAGESFTTIAQCATPANPAATNILIDRATLVWDVVPGANHYNLRFRESGSDDWLTLTYLPSNVRTIYNLDSDVTYEFEVQSSCDGNNSNLSAWTSTVTFTTVGCAAPTDIYANQIATDRATLNWTPSAGASFYNIRFRAVGDSEWINLTSGGSSRTIYGLTIDTDYEWEISANCVSTESNWVSSTFSTTAGCVQVSNMNVSDITENSSVISWDPVPGVSYYRVRHQVKFGPWGGAGVFTNTIETSIAKTGLEADTEYEWQVLTVCPGGENSGFTPKYYYSTLNNARIEGVIVDMNVYPNPTTNEVNLHFVSEELQDVTIKVVDAFGKQVFVDDRTNFVGEYTKAVALGEYAKGVYFLQITTKDNMFYEQIIVK